VTCSRCRQENPPQAKFCQECGTALALRCASCGTQLPPTAKFCFECATPVDGAASGPFRSPDAYTPKHLAERILTSRASLEGERKTVTVLFADLKGSMELLADRDPEEARKILDPVLELMMEPVHRYEGTVNQVMGDGIMALFGAPLAHEDHAVRACYAALRMHDAVAHYAEDLRRTHGVDVQIRVGINSGEVVVRSIGSDLRVDYTAVGQTTHLAARMEQLARAGTTLITGVTLRNAEGYVHVKPLGATPVKGLTEPIEVYELVGAGTARTRLQASAARGLTRFVGRDAEIEQLHRALEQAAAGHGQIVAIVGEPGVGKSRLIYEFIHSHRVHGWLVLESSSVSYGKAASYVPLSDLFKGYFKIADRDDTRTVRAKITGNVLTLDEALKDSVPPLLWLLDALPDGHEFFGLEPKARTARVIEAVKRVLLRESRVHPLVLVFEDLHWIDADTQVVLDSLVESVPSASMLLAVNYRPEYEHGWARKTYYRQLRIDVLSPETAQSLLEPLLGSDPGLVPLRQLLIERTEGNPLFLEESVRALVETEVLVGERGAYRLAKDPVAVDVPPTVQAILAARVDRLPPDDKRLLQTASVIGKDLPWALLLETSDLTEDELRRGLARLQAAEFVYEAKLFPDLEYTFKHALTHEVVYGSLLQERRRGLHARVIAVIERLYPDRLAEHVDQLAHHAFRGEVWDKALHYMRQMGPPSSAPSIDAVMLGGAESTGHLWWNGAHERALLNVQREVQLARSFRNFAFAVIGNFRLGQIYHSLGDYAKAIEPLRRNIQLIEPDLYGETFGLAGLPAVFSRVWLALCLVEQGAGDEATALADEALTIASQKAHTFSQIVGHAGAGIVRALRGEHAAAIAALEPGLVMARMADVLVLVPFVGAPLGWCYALTGRHAEGVALAQDAVTAAEAMNFGANHALRLTWLADAQRAGGDAEDARRTALRAVETGRRHGERGHEAYALALLGTLAEHSRDIETAGQHYRAALDIAESLGMRPLAAAVASRLP
jgi:class 3 adenylate cyclase/tetratricopeptide (TPR) repeat protein